MCSYFLLAYFVCSSCLGTLVCLFICTTSISLCEDLIFSCEPTPHHFPELLTAGHDEEPDMPEWHSQCDSEKP
jgi:hypothetical protein